MGESRQPNGPSPHCVNELMTRAASSCDFRCRHLAPPASASVTLLTVSLTVLLSELSEELNCLPAFVSDPLGWLPALLELPVANVVGANL